MIVFKVLSLINMLFSLIFIICYAYQVFYIVVTLFKKPVEFPEAKKNHRYAFAISARNEENVIGQLCNCIRNQNYPAELIDIYVVADNCDDRTAEVARSHGATVIERNDTSKIGKGYALELLFNQINDTLGYDTYDGYFVVDADNILESDYVYEMNKCFDAGNRLAIGYRNSKNYGDNWISAGYSLWFLRACRQLNSARCVLGHSAEINGTGFLIHKDILKRQGSWVHHLLIEDIEFTVDNVLKGEKVAYCHNAILYDEQPTKFGQSFWQRKRWCRGYLQVLKRYGGKLIGAFLSGKGFSNFDMLMAISPAFFLTTAMMFANLLGLLIVPFFGDPMAIFLTVGTVCITLVSAYTLFFFLGCVTMASEWKRIHVSTGKKLWSLVTFPLFMYTYVPIAACALFSRTKWKPIEHHALESDDVLNSVANVDNSDSESENAAENEATDLSSKK